MSKRTITITGTGTPVYQYAPGDGRQYRWHGGAYIDVYRVADILADADAAPVDTINVWDYATDQPTIARTVTAFTAHVDAWRADR